MSREIRRGTVPVRGQSLKAQAAVELAIFGALILFAFSVLIVYGQRLDNVQQLKMEAFRRAMQKAYYRNSAVSYTLKRDTHIADVFSGLGQGQGAASVASATVMWTKGMPGEQGSRDQSNFAYYEINDSVIDLRQGSSTKTVTGPTGAEMEIAVLPNIWKEYVAKNTRYNTTVTKNETTAYIENTRSSDLEETLNTTFWTRRDVTPYNQQLAEDRSGNRAPVFSYDANPINRAQGAYLITDMNRIGYRDGTGTPIQKGRTWRTNH